ncbi:MAG: hypothetical protein RIR51_1538 [Bacteroidota bacterium]
MKNPLIIKGDLSQYFPHSYIHLFESYNKKWKGLIMGSMVPSFIVDTKAEAISEAKKIDKIDHIVIHGPDGMVIEDKAKEEF